MSYVSSTISILSWDKDKTWVFYIYYFCNENGPPAIRNLARIAQKCRRALEERLVGTAATSSSFSLMVCEFEFVSHWITLISRLLRLSTLHQNMRYKLHQNMRVAA